MAHMTEFVVSSTGQGVTRGVDGRGCHEVCRLWRVSGGAGEVGSMWPGRPGSIMETDCPRGMMEREESHSLIAWGKLPQHRHHATDAKKPKGKKTVAF